MEISACFQLPESGFRATRILSRIVSYPGVRGDGCVCRVSASESSPLSVKEGMNDPKADLQ